MSNQLVTTSGTRGRDGRSRLVLVASVAGALVAVGAIAYGAVSFTTFVGGRSGGIRDAPGQASALAVNAVRVAMVDGYTRERSFAGEVRAHRTSHLAFERTARIATMNVVEGQRVTAGEELAALDVRDVEARRDATRARRDAAQAQLEELVAGPRVESIAAASARVDELEQRLELAQIVEARRRELVTREAISAEELDAARIDATALEASVAAARAELDELEAGTREEQLVAQRARVAELEASLVSLEVELDRSRITAPFDGVVQSVGAEVGSVSAPASPVLTLVEAVDLEAWIGLPPDRAAVLEPGSVHELRVGGRPLEGEFVAGLPGVDPATRTRTAIFLLRDVDLDAAVPGEVAELVTRESIALEGLWLSAEGLVQSRRGLWAAYVLEPLAGGDGGETIGATHRLTRRELETLATDGARVLVRGDLAPGELVLADGAQRVTAGQPVRLAEEIGVTR